jgi:hypothetical protein
MPRQDEQVVLRRVAWPEGDILTGKWQQPPVRMVR